MSTVFWVLLAVVLSLSAAWAWYTAQRLHRLHIRTDAALKSLQAALDRRAALVAALVPEAGKACHDAQAVELRYSTFATRGEREQAISTIIASLGQDTPSHIIDADARLQLAHRFYNDAVADTRALRTRPLVRALHLGGTASLPEYFEYVDPQPALEP